MFGCDRVELAVPEYGDDSDGGSGGTGCQATTRIKREADEEEDGWCHWPYIGASRFRVPPSMAPCFLPRCHCALGATMVQGAIAHATSYSNLKLTSLIEKELVTLNPRSSIGSSALQKSRPQSRASLLIPRAQGAVSEAPSPS
ncbi:hypothetical protein CCACVL1_06230 [Corchorus capsularis]|uniref:Uncharacterized protein n=1 Tax=Corchorus capsularis TaxID=210143 RepID=A0A1R3JGM5_COCAP|nr:hypothetical protein CCACVL1_06230 [Corchorus capsularis]